MMVHYIIYIDGVIQDTSEYSVIENRVFFNQAPRVGAMVQIVSGIGTDTKYLSHTANGHQTVFESYERSELDVLIDDISKYYHHPSIKDELDKLRVILALVKQNS